MQTDQARLLARHFYRRFFDNDLVSPNGDAHDTLALVFTLLALPGFWASLLLLTKYNNPWVSPSRRLLLSIDDVFLLMAVSMIVMAVVTLVQWDALWLEGRDLAVLGPLPIAKRTLILAKLRALALFAGGFAVAVNGIPMVLYPMVLVGALAISAWRAAWLVVALAVALIGAAAFGFLVVLGARALLVTVLGPTLFRRISVAVQLASVFVLTTVYLMLPALSRSFAAAAIARGGVTALLVPPLWYLGLYESLTGEVVLHDPWLMVGGGVRLWRIGEEWRSRAIFESYGAEFNRLAVAGVCMLVLAALVAVVLYALSQRRQLDAVRPSIGTGRTRRWLLRRASFVATRILVRDPAAQASFMFTLQAASRSASHRLYLAGYLAVGFALSAASVSSLLARQGFPALLAPDAVLLAIQFVLSFFLLAGLRVAFSVPSELKSNWIFQLEAGGTLERAMKGVSWALLLPAALLLVALAPFHAVAWGARVAALHLVLGLLAAAILAELLVLRLRKLPFTCSYLPGKGNLKFYWPLYLLGFASYAYLVPALERGAIRSGGWPALVGFLFSLLIGAKLCRWRSLRRGARPVFEELPDPAAVSLDLTGA